MPTYDYVCDACKHEFEAFESIKADPQTVCPSCSASSLRRKIGAGAAVIFKGSGFYQTDYRSDSYKKAAKADSGSSSSPSSAPAAASSSGKGESSSGSSATPAAPSSSSSATPSTSS